MANCKPNVVKRTCYRIQDILEVELFEISFMFGLQSSGYSSFLPALEAFAICLLLRHEMQRIS